ncbi:MAG: BMP family ABC transporter substrate-binding protein [Defluviitaleaceae bacterium]|nr:BMP family ABC transporter substrate-binding protein [Defluviitaleaceae bacterium]
MKKVLKLLLVLSLLAGAIVGFTACGGNDDDDNGNGNGNNDNMNVFLISHSPAPDSTLDDGSFNQGSADGARRFVAAHGGSFRFMQPHEPTVEARLDIFLDAIENGADVLVLPGFHFAQAAYEAQAMFPNTHFIVVDSGPSGAPASNLVGLLYAEHQSGFLAGYAAVREGFTQLGFMGGNPVPAVVRFGHGFLQGADYAAQAMGLEPGTVNVNFHYLGGFGASPEITASANVWYADGTEVIFVAAGAAGNSVAAAAEASNAWMIGVDVDQYHLSPRVITSAMKSLEGTIYEMLVDIMNGNFRGGQIITFDASTNGVALPMNNSRFSTFTQAQYDAIFAAVAGGSVNINNAGHPDDTPGIIASLSIVTVTEI